MFTQSKQVIYDAENFQ